MLRHLLFEQACSRQQELLQDGHGAEFSLRLKPEWRQHQRQVLDELRQLPRVAYCSLPTGALHPVIANPRPRLDPYALDAWIDKYLW